MDKSGKHSVQSNWFAYSIGHPATCSRTRGSRSSPSVRSARSAFRHRTPRCCRCRTQPADRNTETRSTCARATATCTLLEVCRDPPPPRAPEVICHLDRRCCRWRCIANFNLGFLVLAWVKRKAKVACFAGAFAAVLRRKGRGAPRRAALDCRVAIVDRVARPVLFARSACRTLRVVAVSIAPRQASLLACRRAGTVCTGLVLEA